MFLEKVDPIGLKHWQGPRENVNVYANKIHILDYTVKMSKEYKWIIIIKLCGMRWKH